MSKGAATRATRATTSSLAESVHKQLKADILACRLLPGTMLAAAQLAERFAVSRTPVHEALKALCQEGLLRVLPHVGYVVTPVTTSDIDEIFDLRLSLEVLGAGRAAELVTDHDLEGLRAQHAGAQDNLHSGSLDDPAYLESLMGGNRRFHTSIAVLSGYRRLARIVGGLLDEGQRIYFLYYRTGQPALPHHPHDQIIQALAARDPVAARNAMTEHIRDLRSGTHVGSRLP